MTYDGSGFSEAFTVTPGPWRADEITGEPQRCAANNGKPGWSLSPGLLTSASGMAKADSLVFGFQNPAFSGWAGAHVLTIENQERVESRRGRMNLKLIFWPRNGAENSVEPFLEISNLEFTPN